MSQLVLLRSSIAIAVIRLLQTVFPAVIVLASLYIVSSVMGIAFDQQLVTLAAIASALGVVVFRPRISDAPPLEFNASELLIEACFRWVVLLMLLYGIGLFTGHVDYLPREFLMIWALVAGAMIATSHILLLMAERGTVFAKENERSAVVVGVNSGSVLLASRLKQRPEYLTRVVGFFDDRSADRLEPTGGTPILGGLQDLAAYVKRDGIDIIFIALPLRHIHRVMKLLDELRDSTASIYYLPDVFVFDLIQSRSMEVGGVPIIAMCETPFFGYRGVLKRVSDIGFTLAILLPLLPVMLVIALLVKVTSRGPVIFKQRRYGLDGEEILVYKFRSMYVAEDGSDVRQARKEDARITSLGKYLRRLSLDELPQLFNVLQGRMSLVGPRPHAVAHNEMYRRLISGYMMRHKVLPGITGLAQVNGCRGETAELEQMQARVNYDLDYLRMWTPVLDLRILFRTFLQMLGGDKQAY